MGFSHELAVGEADASREGINVPHSSGLGLYDIDAGPDPRFGAEVNCANCNGACCRAGMALPLTVPEMTRLTNLGTIFRAVNEQDIAEQEAMIGGKVARPGRRRSYYVLEADCAALDVESGKCTDYANRPKVCREVKVGGFVCEMARASRGPGSVVMLGIPRVREASDG